jgi:hypothetical protein
VPERLRTLLERLPSYGQIVDMASLGITVGSEERPPRPIEDGYNFRTPADIDRSATHGPSLFLNQPLRKRPGDVDFLFISDQPEEARDDRLREDGSRGASGIYARAGFPRASTIRVLMDHTNGTRRPLRMLLMYLPAWEGTIAVTQRGEAVDRDSVAAGHRAFLQARRVLPQARRFLHVGDAIPLVDLTIKPGQTAVVHLLCAPSVAGQMIALLQDPKAPLPVSLAQFNQIPVLHSIVWREEAERLKKFIDPGMQPTRYRRILNSFQHARGSFDAPDRVARVTYDADSWSNKAAPVRVYSLFESIPGRDPTARDPLDPHATEARTDNRGKYGGVEELRITIARLPPACHRLALLAVNPDGTFGGRHYVTDGHSQERDTWFLPPPRPRITWFEEKVPVDPLHSLVPGDVLPLLEHGKATLLWRGNARPGEVIRMWTEPMANISVYLWYVVVPLPDVPPRDPGNPGRVPNKTP